MTQQLIRSSQN